jgi:hypothetical protein
MMHAQASSHCKELTAPALPGLAPTRPPHVASLRAKECAPAVSAQEVVRRDKEAKNELDDGRVNSAHLRTPDDRGRLAALHILFVRAQVQHIRSIVAVCREGAPCIVSHETGPGRCAAGGHVMLQLAFSQTTLPLWAGLRSANFDDTWILRVHSGLSHWECLNPLGVPQP